LTEFEIYICWKKLNLWNLL